MHNRKNWRREKKKLKDNIKMLEDLSYNFENSINELKKYLKALMTKKRV